MNVIFLGSDGELEDIIEADVLPSPHIDSIVEKRPYSSAHKGII